MWNLAYLRGLDCSHKIHNIEHYGENLVWNPQVVQVFEVNWFLWKGFVERKHSSVSLCETEKQMQVASTKEYFRFA